jgi:hypothetical protein
MVRLTSKSFTLRLDIEVQVPVSRAGPRIQEFPISAHMHRIHRNPHYETSQGIMVGSIGTRLVKAVASPRHGNANHDVKYRENCCTYHSTQVTDVDRKTAQ